MTAERTALYALRWAAADVGTALPEGDLTEAARLAEPELDVLRSIGRLAAVTAARLRLCGPLLGDSRPPGVAAAVVAAAVGAFREGERARMLLRAVRPPTRALDLLAVHGLVAPALARLPQLGDQLRDTSPLTGVLDRPGPRTEAGCDTLFDRLRADGVARPMLVLRFAAPPDTSAQARWRGSCLAAVRHEDPEFVLEVYESAMLHHRREHEVRARVAWRHVLGDGPSEPALPTALWWRALAEFEAAEPGRVRDRTSLEGRRFGTNLYRRLQAWEDA